MGKLGERGKMRGRRKLGKREELETDFCSISSPAPWPPLLPLPGIGKPRAPEILTVTVARQFIEVNQAPWQAQPPL